MADDAAINTVKLGALARKQFGTLSEAEVRVLEAVLTGEACFCGPNANLADPRNDPAGADGWGREREIRAELICWLCLNPEASRMVKPPGIHVFGAKINGLVCLAFANVPFPLGFQRCKLDHIDLHNATVPVLLLTGSSVGYLSADGVQVRGTVFLKEGFSASDEVRLVGGHIGGTLDCDDGTFKNPGVALHADRLEVKGDVLFRGTFFAVGDIRLAGAQIGGTLCCEGGALGRVDLERVVMKGGFLWRNVRSCKLLDLAGASTGSLTDDEASWRETDELRLDGFAYERIINGPTDAAMRLKWLDGQKEFAPQPYRHLAKVMREMGYDDVAKQVLFESESRVRAAERKRVLGSPPDTHRILWCIDSTEDALSWAIIGYGLHPGWAILESIGLAGVGWIIFRRARRLGAMVPTDKEALAALRQGKAPEHYQPFTPLIYSIENCVPLVKFGQDERWQPDPDFRRAEPQRSEPKSAVERACGRILRAFALTPWKLRWFRWGMIALGWLLATFFVAGLTGLIKSD